MFDVPSRATEEKRAIFKKYQTGLVVLFFFTWGTVFLALMSVLYLAPFNKPMNERIVRS